MTRPRRRREGSGIVVVLPKAGSATDEHFAHTYALAGELSKLAPTALIIERVTGEHPRPLPGVLTRVQRSTDLGSMRRVIELVRLTIELRRMGYGSFFVRTSQTAAIACALATRIVGGKVLYWNCTKKPQTRLRDIGLSTALRSELPSRLAFKLADRTVTGTPGLAEHYRRTKRLSHSRVAVLPNEIDLSRYQPASAEQRLSARSRLGIAPQDRVVLTVHRFSPIRQTGRYIPAVPERVLREIPQARFLMVGGGPEEIQLRAAVARSTVAGRVQMLGSVPHEEIRTYYHAADLFLMPSYVEGFPRVLLEAMAMGLPIVSTDVGGVAEVVPHAYRPRLADRDSPDQLARQLVELITDKRLAQRLEDEGLEWVRRYDAPAVARQLIELAETSTTR